MILFDFQKAIWQRRKRLGLTQAQAAELCNEDNDFWRRLESAKRTNVSLVVMDRAVHALGGHLEIVWDTKEPEAESTFVSELYGKYRFTNPEDAALALALAERAFEAGRTFQMNRGRF